MHWSVRLLQSNRCKIMKNEINMMNNFPHLTCNSCKKEMVLSQGDILFDSKWFHKICWKTEK